MLQEIKNENDKGYLFAPHRKLISFWSTIIESEQTGRYNRLHYTILEVSLEPCLHRVMQPTRWMGSLWRPCS